MVRNLPPLILFVTLAIGLAERGHAQCSVREIARTELVTHDGKKLFVEPSAFVSDRNGNILLAGPVDIMTVDSHQITTDTTHNRIFGVVIDSSLRHHAIPNPVAGEISGVRAAPRKRSGWHVIFAETDRANSSHAAEGPVQAVSLWYGVIVDNKWTAFQRLAIPHGVSVYQLFASQLASSGDSLAWVVPIDNAQGRRQLLLYERINGVWSYEIIPSFNSRAEAAYSKDFGLVLAVVQPDSVPGESDGGSLIIRKRSGNWMPYKRLVLGRKEGPVVNPSLSFFEDTMVVAYYSFSGQPQHRRLEARSFVGSLSADLKPFVLDSAVVGEQGPLAPAQNARNVRIWVIRHILQNGAASELRFLRDSSNTTQLLSVAADPFAAYVSTASASSSTILVSGLRYVPGKYIASLLIQFRHTCKA